MSEAGFWTVVELGEPGEPIIAICRTEAEAKAWAAAYDADPRYFGDPEVRPGEFTGEYPDGTSA